MTTTETVPAFGPDIRKEFMLRDKSVFLNHGSYGSMPRCVHERQVRYLQEMESHADIWFRYSLYKYFEASVKKVSAFMGIGPYDTFLLQNVTKATNTVLKQYPLQPGDAFLMTTCTYGAVKVTTNKTVARVKDAKVYTLDIQFPIHCADDIVDMYEKFLKKHPDIKLAIIDHITSPTSVVMPVKKLVELCHKYDVITLIDAAHVPGQLQPDIQDINADFYTGNLHKWVYCPRSCAFLWMNPNRKHAWLKPLVTSAFDDEEIWKAFAYEGTKDDTPYFCTIDGIDYYNRIGGMSTILDYTTNLRKKGVAYLMEKWGTKTLEIPETMVAPNIQVMYLPHIPGYTDKLDKNLALQKLILDTYDVQVAVMPVQGSMVIRVSVQVYSTMDDFVQLADAVLKLAETCTSSSS